MAKRKAKAIELPYQPLTNASEIRSLLVKELSAVASDYLSLADSTGREDEKNELAIALDEAVQAVHLFARQRSITLNTLSVLTDRRNEV